MVSSLKQAVSRLKSLTGRRKETISQSDTDQLTPVPSGSLAVYVGWESRRRFLIPAQYLNFPVFTSLLQKAEEEYGLRSPGGITLPCDVEVFRGILKLLEADEDRFKLVGLEGFLEMFSGSSSAGGSNVKSPLLTE